MGMKKGRSDNDQRDNELKRPKKQQQRIIAACSGAQALQNGAHPLSDRAVRAFKRTCYDFNNSFPPTPANLAAYR